MTAGIQVDSIVRRHQEGLWRYLRLLGCDGATADDLAQETFLALLDAEFEERSERETAAWLRKKARFLFLDRVRWRRRRRERRIADLADEVFAQVAPDDEGRAWLEALAACLRELPARSRTAVAYRYRERLSRAEMARRLSLAENGVKTLLQRVRAALRMCVEERIRV